jgi:hypothetical protein
MHRIMDDKEYHRRRRWRNYALAGVLLGLVVLFFFITMARMGGQ